MLWYQLPDKTAKFTTVWTTVLKVRATFVHQTLTEHALWSYSWKWYSWSRSVGQLSRGDVCWSKKELTLQSALNIAGLISSTDRYITLKILMP